MCQVLLTISLHIGDVKIDNMNRKSQRFIGENATVNINPDNGMVITVWRTGKSTAKKYRKEYSDE